MGTLSEADEAQLKAQLQDAVVASTERCLYHSAKWWVETTTKSHDAHDSSGCNAAAC